MNYASTTEVSRTPGEVWPPVEAGAAIDITRHGTPIAVIVGVGRDEAEFLRAHRAARLGAIVARIHAHAIRADQRIDEDIQAEVDAVCKRPRRRAASLTH